MAAHDVASYLRCVAHRFSNLGPGENPLCKTGWDRAQADAVFLCELADKISAANGAYARNLRRIAVSLQALEVGPNRLSSNSANLVLNSCDWLLDLADGIDDKPARSRQYSVVAMTRQRMSRLTTGVRP